MGAACKGPWEPGIVGSVNVDELVGAKEREAGLGERFGGGFPRGVLAELLPEVGSKFGKLRLVWGTGE